MVRDMGMRVGVKMALPSLPSSASSKANMFAAKPLFSRQLAPLEQDVVSFSNTPCSVKAANRSVVQVADTEGRPLGTGFFFQSDVFSAGSAQPATFMLTNAHVVRDHSQEASAQEPSAGDGLPVTGEKRRFRIQGLADGAETAEASLVACSKDKDLALLALSKPLTVTPPPLSLRDLQAEPLRQDESVFLLGRSNARASQHYSDSIVKGQVKASQYDFKDAPFWFYGVKANFFTFNASTLPGDSGCPAVDQQGRLVGVLSKGASRLSYVIRGDEVLDTLHNFQQAVTP